MNRFRGCGKIIMRCQYLKLETTDNFGVRKCLAGLDSSKCPKSRGKGIPSVYCWKMSG